MCESCESEVTGFVRAVEDSGEWKLDLSYNHGSYIDDDVALKGEG